MVTQIAMNPTPITQPTLSASKNHVTTEISLILHTMIAQSLLIGSWGHKKMGLVQFAKVVQSLWEPAKEDDPYAQWYLMKIYEQINALKEEVKKVKYNCQKKFTELRGLEIQIFHNTESKKFPLSFSTPFSYMAAYLIADMDYIFRQAAVLKQLGIVLEADQTPAYFAQKMRELFTYPRYWQYTGVTRKDINDNNQKAQKAKELMGEVPEAVLKNEIQFMFLPKTLTKRKKDAVEKK